jgi:hypothetical protein
MLENKYELCYAWQPEESGMLFRKMEELLNTQGIKEIWSSRRDKFLSESIDPTSWLVDFIENYEGVKPRHRS